MITEEARNTMDGNVVVRVVAEVAAWGAKGEETLGNYFTDESEGMREYNLPPSSFHPTFVSGGLMLIHTNWLHYSRFIHLQCLFSLFRNHSSLPSLLTRSTFLLYSFY